MLDLLGIPRACCRASCRRRAPAASAIAMLGGREVPLAGIAGDQQAALFGQACFAPGMAKNTYGTGCFMLMNTGTRAAGVAQPPADDRRLARCGERHYALEGAVFVGGAVVQWLRDGLGFIENSADVEALAATRAGQRRRVPGARRSPGSAARTGTRTPAAPSSA